MSGIIETAAPSKPRYAICDEAITALVAEGIEDERIATLYGVSTRTVERARERAGLTVDRQPNPITPDEWVRVLRAIYEGIPLPWIAEEYGRDPKQYYKRFRPGQAPEWATVWRAILKNPALLELHNEFAPPTVRSYHA